MMPKIDPRFDKGAYLRVKQRKNDYFEVELARKNGSTAWRWNEVEQISIDSHILNLSFPKKQPKFPALPNAFIIKPKPSRNKELCLFTSFEKKKNALFVKVRPCKA